MIGLYFLWNNFAASKEPNNKKNPSLICSDISALRALHEVEADQSIQLLEYHKSSGMGGGVFRVDINDFESPDDGGSCIINTSNQRLKRICPENIIRASHYGMTGDNIDCAEAFMLFLNCGYDKYIDVDIFTSASAKLKDGSNLTAKKGCIIRAIGSIDKHRNKNNQGQTIEVGNDCIISNVEINGGGFRNNGFLVFKKKNVIIEGCKLGNGLGQCILDVFSHNTHYKNNTLYKAQHGIQYWGSSSGLSSDNHVYKVTGGIWTACASEIVIKNNYIHDCSDVGIDFEGGNNCLSDGNTVEYCSNGELAVFGTGKEFFKRKIPMGNLAHKNNIIKRRGFYFDRYGNKKENHYDDLGACSIFGNIDSDLIGPIVFEGNNVNVESGDGKSLRCFASRDNSNSQMNLFFLNNSFSSSSEEIGLILPTNSVVFERNKFKVLNKEAKDSTIEIKGVSKVFFKGNEFDYKLLDSSVSPAILVKNNNYSEIHFEGNSFFSSGHNVVEIQKGNINTKLNISKNTVNNFMGCESDSFEINCKAQEVYLKVKNLTK